MANINITNTHDVVEYYLTKWEHLRDNDEKLIATIWREEARKMGHDLDKLSAMGFLKILAEGKLTNSESIRRTRQKIQHDNVELQGKNYKKRKSNEENIKKQIRG